MPNLIIDRLKLRDRTALGELYDRHAAALFQIILRLVPTRQLAEQVLEDTFVAIWRSADSIGAFEERPFVWMLAIARRTANGAMRTATMHAFRESSAQNSIVSDADNEAEPRERLGLHEQTG